MTHARMKEETMRSPSCSLCGAEQLFYSEVCDTCKIKGLEAKLAKREAEIEKYSETVKDLADAIIKLEADRDKLREACQATYDYFLYLCQHYHGEKTDSGKPKLTGTKEIERLCDKAGLLVKEALVKAGETK